MQANEALDRLWGRTNPESEMVPHGPGDRVRADVSVTTAISVSPSKLATATVLVRLKLANSLERMRYRLQSRPATENAQVQVTDSPQAVEVEQLYERITEAPSAISGLKGAN